MAGAPAFPGGTRVATDYTAYSQIDWRPSVVSDPHRDQPVLPQGAGLASAAAAVILLHGRGASAEDIMGLASEMYDKRFAYLAPQAAGHSWYPNSFLAPIEKN